jgi:hypothetical protein
MVNNKPYPLFDLVTVRGYVSSLKFALVTTKARHQYQDLEWTSQHIVELFELLDEDQHLLGNQIGMESDNGPLDCDHYCIKIVEMDRNDDYDPTTTDGKRLRRAAIRESCSVIYLKFSLDTCFDPEVGIVSIHLSS